MIQTIGSKNQIYTNKTLALSYDRIYVGIPDYLKPSIMKIIKEYFQQSKYIPCGTLTVFSGLYSEYGSGSRIYCIATKCLLKILFEESKSSPDEIVQNVLDDEAVKQKEFYKHNFLKE